MDIKQIQELQRDFDAKHGWSTTDLPPLATILQLEQDLIGLMGEVGEAANILKKIRRETNGGQSPESALSELSPQFREELVDTFIYLLRLFDLSEVEIEKDYLAKLSANGDRFRKYEQ